jgi:hypothetical protein
MKRNLKLLSIPVIILTLSANHAMGANALTKDEAQKLLNGNTAEGVNTKWDKKMIWYFQEGGTLRKQKSSGQRGKAKWRIDDKGQLCYMDKHMSDMDEKCEPIISRDDGKYDANDGKWRFDKVLPGNPHNL